MHNRTSNIEDMDGCCLTLDPIFEVKPLPESLVKVGGLVVNGIVVGVKPLALLSSHLLQKVPDLEFVLRMENVPKGTRQLVSTPHPLLHGNVTP